MIVGIGVDIVDVERVKDLLARYRDRFVRRVFTDTEAEYAGRSVREAERLAGRFAVKEAVLKAFGTGKSQGIRWRDVETVRGAMGKPEVKLYGNAIKYMNIIKGKHIHVSITHDGGKAVAFVVIEAGEASA
ncbi:MAG: holo-ACP synthase [Deltaproteobacteria bacterium]|nr:holo-ACP synthase [Deltaproteobacteria bacterium]NNG47241.1 holo-ACP synthase [Deltaproteobacteria bacterium]